MAVDPYDPALGDDTPDPNAPPPDSGTATPADPNASPDGTDPDAAFPGLGDSTSNQSFSIPGDLVGPINEIAAQYGIPYPLILAAAVHQLTRFAKTKTSESVINTIAAALQKAYQSQLGSRNVPAAQTDPSTVRDLWFGAAARVTGVSKQTFDNLTRKAPPTTANIGYKPQGTGGKKAAAPIIPGLPDETAAAVQRIADSLFLQYTGKFPTTEEYIAIAKGGFTQQTLEQHLRAQPDPRYKGFTVGQAYDIVDLANRSAQSINGRDATLGEINWLLTNKVPIDKENLDAFYTQIKTGAVWQVKPGQSPKDWLAMQARVQRIWDSFGLTGTVPWQMVNEAEMGGLTEQQITEKVKALPAPGMPEGTTVGEAERVRNLAKSIKEVYFPGEDPTPEELKLLSKMSAEQMTKFFRDLPSKDAPGVTAGAAKDYRTMAEKFFQSMGITGELPTAADLLFLSTTKADYSQLAEHFASDPKLALKYPGLAYGMSSEDFQSAMSGFGSALEGVFGKGSPELGSFHAPTGVSKQTRESTLYGAALADRMSPAALASTVDEFRAARGRAPSGDELRTFRDTPRKKLPQSEGGPGTQQTELGPTAPGLRGAGKGDPHPAVSR